MQTPPPDPELVDTLVKLLTRILGKRQVLVVVKAPWGPKEARGELQRIELLEDSDGTL
jgi:hypothetical protein